MASILVTRVKGGKYSGYKRERWQFIRLHEGEIASMYVTQWKEVASI